MALLFITIIIMVLMRGCEGCVETERMGLLQLKSYLLNLRKATEGSILDSWSHNDSESDCCNWERVNCSDTIGGHIVNLTLSDIMLYTDTDRPLNLSLFHSFPQLETLDLSSNLFTDLEKLRTLDFFANRLNKSVLPFLSAAKSLRTLYLGINRLEDVSSLNGYSETCRLRYLRELDLSGNTLTNLPYCLGNLSRLRTLDLSDNQLEGVFSPTGYKSFHRMEKLRTLDLSSNQLEALNGVVFPSSLQVLNLENNQLSLTPEEICRLRYLRELDLSSNILTNLPYCLRNLSHLQTLHLSHINQREGVLSLNGCSEICRLRYLRELDLTSTDLTNLPCLGNLSHLRTLDLSGNQLNGNLSSFVSDLPSALEYLSLLQNNFNGLFFFISLVNQTKLTVFKLSSNVGMIHAQSESSWLPLFQLKIPKLQNFNFGSKIPGFLVHQHDLLSIDISHNKLMGAFPTCLVQNNTSLQSILMYRNLLTSLQLPRLVHGLEVFDISRNRIYDSIQEDIGIVFPNLRYMNISLNHLHGTIPSSVGKMKSLEYLDMSSNDLYGKLPKMFLSGCYSLGLMDLSNNQFHGNLFSEHISLTHLAFLFLGGNSFVGSLEKGLLKLENLRLLDISDNRFSGILPLGIGRMSWLVHLDICRNQLKGPFPVQLQNLQLDLIDISHSSFSGSIPRNMNFPVLRELRLHNNEFMGSIPDTLFKSPLLQVLDLRSNNLSGKIPDTIGKASRLRALLLPNNSLQGHTFEKICQLSKVSLLDLSHNKFKGVIPSCLGNMSFGEENNVRTIRGYISYDIFFLLVQNWSYTSALSLDYHRRTDSGSSPPTIVDFVTKSRYEAYQGGILRYMSGLDLSSNQLSGEIPIEIGDLENIRSLSLSCNHLTGSIPNSFSKLKDLGSLDLSNNKLDGNIPPMLADLNSLGYFNVSCNNLSGEIPSKGHLLTFGIMSYIGNDHLCGLPTNKNCNPTVVLEPSASKQAKEDEGDDDVIDMVWFYWTCGAVYISTSLALFVFLCIDSHWSRKWYYGVDLFIYHLQRFKCCFISS